MYIFTKGICKKRTLPFLPRFFLKGEIFMRISKELAKGSTGLLVLSVLSRQELYGYQIIKTVELMSESVFQMNEGTLYPILHALEQEGMLSSYWAESPDTGKRRKYYKITDAGLRELQMQKQAWDTYQKAVNRVIGGVQSATV